jgi:hypothetical protein
MTADALQQNWALWAATIPLIVVAVAVARSGWRRTAQGRLRAVLREHRSVLADAAKARRQRLRAEKRVRRLQRRADKVKPRVLAEARASLSDSEALARIADDRTQVAANQLRKVIYEEFPPTRHEALRARYLPADVADGRPFTF